MGGRRGYPLLPVAVLLALSLPLLAACGATGPQSTIAPMTDVAQSIQGLYALVFWLAAGVFVVVEGLLLFAIIRFRRRGDRVPGQVHGNRLLEVGWTLVPAIVVVAIAVPTWQVVFANSPSRAPEDALRVEVTGYQWWWDVRYPGLGVATANEIHVPVDRPVVLYLDAGDVIHSFWVPQLGGKQDMLPGRTLLYWFTPHTPGTYQGQCAELCGVSHAWMRLQVVVDGPGAFDAWVVAQRQEAAPPQGAEAQEGAMLFATRGCAACHTVRGAGAAGTLGPDLTHVGSRATIAAATLQNTREEMVRWLLDPGSVKPGSLMPDLGLAEGEARALAVYLLGLE